MTNIERKFGRPVQPAQSIRKVRMKIQTVRTVEFNCVEGLIAECQADGFYPNRLVIQLNPDPPESPERSVAINPQPKNRPEQTD